ncbi:hypothetical protein [Colwellia psychrerythraea]|uniref:Lipoprotein n=1 Tax=Colwellia psychrerythraea TaxID=28229 RepID=A0A099KKK4_COLPS|nr:hypothetical protein [Colwellia psychrerythraea]KGJ90961.1 hypothetical protein GAB14E_0625 [Colwellia psychrerythraea]
MKIILLSLAIIALTGCATNQYLQPIPSVDNAKLRFVSIPSNNNFVSEGSVKECIPNGNSTEELAYIVTLGFKANLVRSLNRIDMPAYNNEVSDSHQNEVYIPAGNKFFFQFNGVGISGFAPGQSDSGGVLYSWCRKAISFVPTANSNYEAVYDYVELPNGKETCGVKLFEIVEQSSETYSKVEVEDYKIIENYCK